MWLDRSILVLRIGAALALVITIVPITGIHAGKRTPKCTTLEDKPKRSSVVGSNITLLDVLGNGLSRLFPATETIPQDVVLVLGNTGSGKTTLTQMIAGDLTKLHAVLTKRKVLVIVDDEERIGAPVTTSRTIVPELLITEKESFFDCPGFDDNRGAVYDVAVNYFMNQITERVSRVKLIFLINHNSVEAGQDRNEFDRLVDHATRFVKGLSNFQASLGLVVTKVDDYLRHERRTMTDEEIKESIVEFLDTYRDGLKERIEKTGDEKQRDTYAYKDKLVNIFLSNDTGFYERITFSTSPDSCVVLSESAVVAATRTRVLAMIRNLNFTEVGDPSTNFGFTLKEKTIRQVKENYTNEVNMAVRQNLMKDFHTWYNTIYAKINETLPIVGKELLMVWENLDNLTIDKDTSLTKVASDLCLSFSAMGYNCSQQFKEFMAEKQTYFEFFDKITESKVERRNIEWLHTVNIVRDVIKKHKRDYENAVDKEFIPKANEQIATILNKTFANIGRWLENSTKTSFQRIEDLETFNTIIRNLKDGFLNITKQFSDTFDTDLRALFTRFGIPLPSDYQLIRKHLQDLKYFDQVKGFSVRRNIDQWKRPLLNANHDLDEKMLATKEKAQQFVDEINRKTEQEVSDIMHMMDDALDRKIAGMSSLELQTNLQATFSRLFNFKSSPNLYQLCSNLRTNFNGHLGVVVSSEFVSDCSHNEERLQKLEHVYETKLTRNDSMWLSSLKRSMQRVQDFQSWYTFCDELSRKLDNYETHSTGLPVSALSHETWKQFLDKKNDIHVSSDLFFIGEELRKLPGNHFNYLFQLLQNGLTVEVTCRDHTVFVKGDYIKFKDAVQGPEVRSDRCSETKGFELYAKKKIFLDYGYTSTVSEFSIVFVAPYLEVIGEKTIRLDGVGGKSHYPYKADNGKYTWSQDYIEAGRAVGIQVYTVNGKNKIGDAFVSIRTNKTAQRNEVSGTNPDSRFHKYLQSLRSGVHGLAGRPGGNGGSFIGIFSEIIRASNLKVIANGGDGGPGQDGGNGADGNYCVVDPGVRCDWTSYVGGRGGHGGERGTAGGAGRIEIFAQHSNLVKKEASPGKRGQPGKGGIAGVGGRGANNGLNAENGVNGWDGWASTGREQATQRAPRKTVSYARQTYLNHFGNEATYKFFNHIPLSTTTIRPSPKTYFPWVSWSPFS